MATRLESAIARIIAEGRVRSYEKHVRSPRATRTRSTAAGRLWRGRQRFHTRRGQSCRDYASS